MIFDMNNQESNALLNQWQSATKETDSLILEFSAAIKAGWLDTSSATQLSERMMVANNKAMDILDQLQKHRLDE